MYVHVMLLMAVLRTRLADVRDRDEQELGASAIEWAIIAAVSVVIATMIGVVVYNVVQGKGDQLKACADVTPGTDCKHT